MTDGFQAAPCITIQGHLLSGSYITRLTTLLLLLLRRVQIILPPAFFNIPAMSKIIEKIKYLIYYCTEGVWESGKDTLGVRLVKTANLAVKSFMDRGLQIKSMSLTYSTVLAIVPALALLLAIGRGFGLQDLLTSSIYSYFPSQTKAIATAMKFVDSYLKEASSGIFVGVGLVFLLWTVISLLSYIEDAFNNIWDVKHDRNLYQKITDYIAICLMIPILIICSSGLSIFMATTIEEQLKIPFLTPLLNKLLELSPFILVWIAFSLSFWLIPNTKVSIKYAMITGAICAVAFQILQMLFFSGQLYVSKYNAIYGSFAFLPLLLIWLQLSWLILLSGCVLTYSLQNIFTFDFLGDYSTISADYLHKMEVIVMAVVAQDFNEKRRPKTIVEISTSYDIPIRIANKINEHLSKAGMVYQVDLSEYPGCSKGDLGLTPAVDINTLSVSEFLKKIDAEGNSNFIPRFSKIYGDTLIQLDKVLDNAYPSGNDILIKDISLPAPDNGDKKQQKLQK